MKQKKKSLSNIFDVVEYPVHGTNMLDHQGLEKVIEARTNFYTELDITNHLKVTLQCFKNWMKEDGRTQAWNEVTESLGDKLLFDILDDIEQDVEIDVDYDEDKPGKSQFELDKQHKKAIVKLKSIDQKIRAKDSIAKTLNKNRDETDSDGITLQIVGLTDIKQD